MLKESCRSSKAPQKVLSKTQTGREDRPVFESSQISAFDQAQGNEAVMKSVIITNMSRSNSASIRAGYCGSFLCQLRGLMFRKTLPTGEGLMLVQKKEDRISSSIHMMFMHFDICAVWINQALEVVDVRYARRWGLAYVPRSPACYVLELNADHIKDFSTGDKVKIDELQPAA